MERIITYSPAYTLVPTYECFNRCTYCNFRVDPDQDRWMSLSAAQDVLSTLHAQSVIEILILSGEVHPHSKRRLLWFQRIYRLCELALEMGFLPHTNVGPLSYEEMAKLRQVNVSMGLWWSKSHRICSRRCTPTRRVSGLKCGCSSWRWPDDSRFRLQRGCYWGWVKQWLIGRRV